MFFFHELIYDQNVYKFYLWKKKAKMKKHDPEKCMMKLEKGWWGDDGQDEGSVVATNPIPSLRVSPPPYLFNLNTIYFLS